jgi:hypothetical protein
VRGRDQTEIALGRLPSRCHGVSAAVKISPGLGAV